jgi:hypothetical protein
MVPPPFSGIGGAKRRRLRSGGTLDNSEASVNGMSMGNPDIMEEGDTEKTAQTSKCKGATTIPIFLKSK